MDSSDVPPQFAKAFAEAAAAPDITYPIPTDSQVSITPGRASLETGWPHLNLTPVAAGGIPPFGQDANGIMKQVTLWNQWQGIGGPVFYDAAQSTALGGYPQDAKLASTTVPGAYWVSLIDANTSDPDAGGANWLLVNGGPTSVAATGALTVLNNGLVLIDATSGNVIVTLPLAAVGGNVHYRLVRVDNSANTVTVQRAGSDTFLGVETTATFTSFQLPYRSASVDVDSNGVSQWIHSQLPVLPGATQFTANGNFTVPANVYRIFAEGWGGGGGGGATNAGNTVGGGGGGGGEYRSGFFAVTPGQVIAVTIGTAGAGGGSAGSNGTNGGNTTVGALMTMAGGGGGVSGGTTGAGGAGGSGGSNGSVFYNGQSGNNANGAAAGAGGGAGGGGQGGVSSTGAAPGGGGAGGAASASGTAGAAGPVTITYGSMS